MSPPVTSIVVVRVYLTESRARLKRVLALLRESERLRGATVFRGIAGFGTSTPRTADAAEPLDAPVVIEFFDTAETVEDAIAFIRRMIAPRHIVTFPASMVRP